MPPLTTFPAPPEPGNVYHADALALLAAMPDASVDAVITDPPYGFEKTKEMWDSNVLPFDVTAFMEQCLRVIKPRGAICVFAAPPFNGYVMFAALNAYRYSWYYEKARGSNFGNSHHQPLRIIEEILVFSPSIASANQFTSENNLMHYHPPQVKLDRPYIREDKPHHKKIALAGEGYALSSHVHNPKPRRNEYRFQTPTNLFYAATDSDRGLHSTQKPVSICEYLVEAYTAPGDLIVDPFCGSGTSLLAARNLNRRFIGGDITESYVDIARKRLAAPYTLPLFEHPAP